MHRYITLTLTKIFSLSNISLDWGMVTLNVVILMPKQFNNKECQAQAPEWKSNLTSLWTLMYVWWYVGWSVVLLMVDWSVKISLKGTHPWTYRCRTFLVYLILWQIWQASMQKNELLVSLKIFNNKLSLDGII